MSEPGEAMIIVTIPGEPVAQGRPRAFVNRQGQARVYDPAKSRNWKATAQEHFARAIEQEGRSAPLFPEGPVALRVLAIFTCPRSHWRKRDPLPRRAKVGRPDCDNIVKAIFDSANGVLFTDDAQVVRVTLEKVVGAQGEAPRVVVEVFGPEASEHWPAPRRSSRPPTLL